MLTWVLHINIHYNQQRTGTEAKHMFYLTDRNFSLLGAGTQAGSQAAQAIAAVLTVAGEINEQYAGSCTMTMLLAVKGVNYALGA